MCLFNFSENCRFLICLLRGHRFERYADDSIILCRSKSSAKRVCTSVTKFVEKELHLSVNRDKTGVGYIRGMKYLGYSFYFAKSKCRLCVHKKTKDKFKRKLKSLTGRSNGMGYARRKELLWQPLQEVLEESKDSLCEPTEMRHTER